MTLNFKYIIKYYKLYRIYYMYFIMRIDISPMRFSFMRFVGKHLRYIHGHYYLLFYYGQKYLQEQRLSIIIVIVQTT